MKYLKSLLSICLVFSIVFSILIGNGSAETINGEGKVNGNNALAGGNQTSVSESVYNQNPDLDKLKLEDEKNLDKVKKAAKGEKGKNTRVLVKFKNIESADKVKKAVAGKLKTTRLEFRNEIKSRKIQVFEIGEADNMESVISEFKKNSEVEYAQEDRELDLFAAPTDPRFQEQWGLYNNGQAVMGQSGISGVDINALNAWDKTKGSEDVVVGILDTGIDIYHEDLKENIYINNGEIPGNGIDDDANGYIDDINGWDFSANDNTVFDSANDDMHGTHVAGIIAAKENGTGVLGTSPNVKVLPLKFINGNFGYTSDVIEAIEYSKKMGIQIINCSWGGTGENTALKEAMAESGILYVCAAGNLGVDSSSSPVYPANFDIPNIISVAAIDNKGYIAPFSSYGSSIDIAAPGVNILSTLPGNGYGMLSGTSMAAPFVTGTAALLKSFSPEISVREIINRINNNAAKTYKLERKVSSGGRVDALAVIDNIMPKPEIWDPSSPVSSQNSHQNKNIEEIISLPTDNLAVSNGKVKKPLLIENSIQSTPKRGGPPPSDNGLNTVRYDLEVQNISPLSYIYEVEPNDTSSTGMPVSIGTVYATISPNNLNDWFIVNLEANKQYTISLKGLQAGDDLGLFLYNPDLSYGGESDHFGNADESITITTTTAGYYYINTYCFSYAPSGEHTYQLLIYPNDAAPDSYEPNDSKNTAKSIVNNTPVSANININTDEDWYVINADRSGRLTITLDNIPYGCDYDVSIYDGSTFYMGGSYFINNANEKANILIPSPGQYYIRVYSYTGSDPSVNYELKAGISTPDSYETNDYTFEATDVAMGSSILATIDNKRDDDWFEVYINEAGNYTFELQNIPAGTDYDIYINDFAGNYVTGSFMAANTNEYVNVPLNAGNYYIKIYSYSGFSETLKYTFSLYKENSLTIAMPYIRANAGDTIQVPVNIHNLPIEGICNFDFSIKYDKNVLTYTGFTPGTLTNTSDAEIDAQDTAEGVKVLYVDNSSAVNMPIRNSGELFKLNFTMNSNVTNGAYELSYNNGWCFGRLMTDGNVDAIRDVVFKPGLLMSGSYGISSLHSAVQPERVEALSGVTGIVYGDLNGDGLDNSTDLTLLKRYIFGIITEFPSPNGKTAAEVSGDGLINSTDYTLVKRKILKIIEVYPVELITPTPTASETPTPSPSVSPSPTDSVAPTAPTNLKMIDRTDTSISLEWTASTDIDVAGYNIYRKETIVGTTSEIKVGSTNETHFNDTNLKQGTKYTYTITAYDKSGLESDKSEPLEVTTYSLSIEKLFVAQVDNSITVSWNAVIGASSYLIEVDGIAYDIGNSTSYKHTNLIPNTRHTYKVHASNQSVWSEKITVYSYPGKPIDVNATINETTNTVTISWEAVNGINKYLVFRSDKVDPIAATSTLEYIDKDSLLLGIDYTYEVRAIDASGKATGDSGRVIVNTGTANIGTDTVLYENRVYMNLLYEDRTGRANQGPTLNMNSYKLTVCKNFKQTSWAQIHVNQGRMEIYGDYNISGGFELDEPYLRMTNNEDYIYVGGSLKLDVEVDSYFGEHCLSAGTIEIKGDFILGNTIGNQYKRFSASGTHKVILTSDKLQSISIEYQLYNYFNILDLSKSKGVVIKNISNDIFQGSEIRANQLIGIEKISYTLCDSPVKFSRSNVSLITDTSIDGNVVVEGGSLNLYGKSLEVKGDLKIQSRLELGGGNLTVVEDLILCSGDIPVDMSGSIIKVDGNLIQTRATLDINKGILKVAGNYTIDQSIIYLKMDQEEDYVYVGGNFYVKAYAPYGFSEFLSEGTIEIKGDFKQEIRSAYTYSFNASNKHKVFLSGERKQNISFVEPRWNHFNILCINKPLEHGYNLEYLNNYPDAKPWNTLEEDFSSTPRVGTTVTKASLSPARKELALAEVNAKLYAFGGSYPDPANPGKDIYLDTVSEYDYLKNQWSVQSSTGISPDPKRMLSAKGDMAVAASDSEIYLIGGYDGTRYLSTVEVYNPAAGEFTKRDAASMIPNMPTARRGAKAVLIGRKIYVIGGYDGTQYLDKVEVYDLDSIDKQWITKQKNSTTETWMTPRSNFGMAAYGGKIYVFGGVNSSGYLSSIEEYNPATNTWTTLSVRLSTARKDLAACTMSGRIYTLGGTNGSVLGTVEEFDPETKTIKSWPILSKSRSAFGAAVAYNRIFIVGGIDGNKVLSDVAEYFTKKIPGLKFLDSLNGLKGNRHLYDKSGVNKVSGNYLTQVEDFRIDSPAIDLEVIRTYNSSDVEYKDAAVTEDGWRFNFETSIKDIKGEMLKVTASTLNLREEPGNLSSLTYTDPVEWDIIQSLANGSYVKKAGAEITVGSSKWYKVITKNGVTGWVSARYVKAVYGIEITYDSGTKLIFEPDDSRPGYYISPPGNYDILRKIAEGVFTLTTKEKITYEYHSGRLAFIHDRYGNKIKFEYENDSTYGTRLKKIFDCDPINAGEIGRTLTLNYNAASGKLENIIDKAGRKVSFTYYADGKLDTVTDQNDSVTKYYYYAGNDSIEGARHKLESIARKVNSTTEVKVLTNKYDGNGRLYKQLDNLNRPTYYLYEDLISDDKSDQVTDKNEIKRTVIDKRGNSTVEVYNVNFPGRPIKKIDPNERETLYSYYVTYTEGTNSVTYNTTNLTNADLNSNVNDHKHRAYNVMRMRNLPEKTETTIEMLRADGVVKGNTTKVEKDEKGNVYKITNPDNTTRTYSYYANGDLEYEIDEANQQTYYYYESYGANGRLTKVIKPADKGVIYTTTNREEKFANTENIVRDAITSYIYKADGGTSKIKGCLVEKITYANGTWISYEYNDNGTLLSSSAEESKKTTFTYDGCFRVTSETTPLGYKTEYRYNNLNQVTHVIKKNQDDSIVSTSRSYYDYAGRKRKEVNPLLYDATKDSGADYSGTASSEYEYDPYGRITKLTSNVRRDNGTEVSYITNYFYDTEGNLERTERGEMPKGDATGKVSRGVYIYNYDSLKRLTGVSFKEKASDINSLLLEEYSYDYGTGLDNGTYASIKLHKKYLNDNEFALTTYWYDFAGRLVKVINPKENNSDPNEPTVSTDTAYYSDGKVKSVKDARGNTTYYTYGNFDYVSDGQDSIRYEEKLVPVEKEGSTYRVSYSGINYDKAGRKVQEINYVDLIEASWSAESGKYIIGSLLGKKSISVSYSYYNDSKVKLISYSNGKKFEYFYDDDGNLIEERTTFDKDASGQYRKNIILYLDYNAHGKPEKTAVLIKNSDLNQDIISSSDNIVPFESLFYMNEQGVTVYGPYEYHANSSAIVTTYSNFDAQGNAGTITYPNNSTESYIYDSLGRVVKKVITAKDVENPQGEGQNKNVETITTYNWEGKVSRVEVRSKYGTVVTPLSSVDYVYSNRGFLIKTTNSVTLNKYNKDTKTITKELQSLSTAYEYDTAGRLIAEVSPQNYIEGQKPSGADNYIKYTYYKSGLLKTKSFVGYKIEYNPADKLFHSLPSSIVIEAYTYDENGNVKKKVDGEAYSKASSIDAAYGVEYTYNLSNQVETVKNPEITSSSNRNYNKSYMYDGLGRKVSEFSAYGKEINVLKYDSSTPLNVSSLKYSLTMYAYGDASNELDVYIMEDIDNPIAVEKRIKTENYDYLGNIKIIKDAKENGTVYEYNDLGKVRNITYPGDDSIDSNTVEYKYDSMGNIKLEKNGLGICSEYEYDPQGRVLGKKVYKEGEIDKATVTRYWYDLHGNVKYEIDPNGVVTEYQYDELGRVIKTSVKNEKLIDAGTGNISTLRTSVHEKYICYNKDGKVGEEVEVVKSVDSVTKASYRVYVYKYDNMGRLIEKIDPSGVSIEKINYNLNSAQTQSFDGEDHLKEFQYNKDGMLAATKDYHENGKLHIWRQTYDAAGNIATKEDGLGNETLYIYNEFGQLKEVKFLEFDSNNSQEQKQFKDIKTLTLYSYDANGNMETQSFNGKLPVKYEYNARNLLIKKTYSGAVANVETFSYYKDGSLKQKVDRENIKTTYQYNPQGLVAEENAARTEVINGIQTTTTYTKRTYSYDKNGNVLAASVESSRGSGNSIIRTYDDVNRVITKSVSGVTGKAVYVYDIVTDGGMIAETSVDQMLNKTTKVYDAVGRLEYVKNGNETSSNIASYSYYKNGARKSVVYSSGATETYEYFDDGLLKKLTNGKDGTTLGIIETFEYTYDANHNIRSKVDKKGKTEYEYDAQNRLKLVNEIYCNRKTEYTYDSAGNRETEKTTVNDSVIQANVYTYSDSNWLTGIQMTGQTNKSVSFGYDNNGNQTSSSDTGFENEYDEFNQLVKTTKGTTDTFVYTYNAEGYRIGKSINGSLTTYLYEYDKVVLELDSVGNQTGRNIYGTNLLMRTTGGQSYYYMYNG
ncbi:MAG: S8 family serine peptidase, partial [Bacillota bacterium]